MTRGGGGASVKRSELESWTEMYVNNGMTTIGGTKQWNIDKNLAFHFNFDRVAGVGGLQASGRIGFKTQYKMLLTQTTVIKNTY